MAAVISSDSYWCAYAIWAGINTLYGLIMFFIFVYTSHVGIESFLKRINMLSICYILSYTIGYGFLCAYGIGGFLCSPDSAGITADLKMVYVVFYYLGQISFDGFGLIFITMMTFRLRDTFKDTQYTLNHNAFLVSHILTVIAFALMVTFEVWDISDSIYEVSSEPSIILDIYYVLVILIELWLMYLFILKVYRTNALQCKLYDSDNKLSTTTERQYMAQVMINSVMRQSLLAICAMSFDCMYLGVALIRNVLGSRNDAAMNIYIVVWYLAIIPTWTKLFCIYLSFGYMSNAYDRICKCCHRTLKTCCQRLATRNVENEDLRYKELYDMDDNL